MTRAIYRLGTGAICSAGLAMSSLTAADHAVTTTADSGAGSLRQAVSVAVSGDTITFSSSLNNTTLVSDSALIVNTPVTLQDPTSTPITLVDVHAISLGARLTIDWNGTLVLNGVISDASSVSSGSLANTGPGTLLLSAANTFTGGTTLSDGTIQISNSTGLGTGALTVNGSGGTQTLNLGNGLTLANAISLQSALTVNSAVGSSNTLSGIISGSGALKTTGDGTLILSSANTFSGGVAVAGSGTLSLQNKSSLGTGTLTNTGSGSTTLILADGLVVSNKISLAENITVNVATATSTGTGTGTGSGTAAAKASATLSGAISGTASSQFTKTGDGTLILSGANSYTGGTLISQGTLQGNSTSLFGNITDNGSLVFNQLTSGTFAGNISGTGGVTKSGAGTLIYSGNSTLTGATTVSAGDLQVMGTWAGPITVSGSTAMLSGTGTVGNVTNNGLVEPGTATSIGTLNVHGNYTQTSGSAEIKLDSTTTSTPGTSNDNLVITGTAKLGGSLKVLGVGTGTYTAGTQYTFLNATGGVSGQFAQALTDIPNRRVSVTYDANDVMFQLQTTTSPKAAATTSNQLSVGTAIDNIALTSTGSLAGMISDLGVRSADQQRQALNQLSGQMFGNLQTLGLEIGDQFQQRVTSALVSNGKFLVGEQDGPASNSGVRGQSPPYNYDQAMPYGSSRGWFQGYGFGGSLRSDGNGAAMNFGQGGGIYAVELGEDETGRIGVVGGNTYGAFSDGFGGAGTINSYQLGMYTLKHDDVAYVLGSANYGYNQYYTHRTVSIGTVDPSLNADLADQRLTGNYEGSQIGANAETGLKLSAGIFHIQPLIGLQYLYLCQQGFDESGGAAAVTVARSRANSLRASIGARVLASQLVGPGGSIWTPYSHVRLVSDLLDNDRIINASFSGSPAGGAFTSHGTRIGPNYGVIGEGVEIRLNESWSLFGGGELTFGDRIVVGTGSIGALTVW